MRAIAAQIVLLLPLLLFGGCTAAQRDISWHTVDEGSFTLEIPLWLHRKDEQGIDSHVGEYVSSRMQLDFDEVYGLSYTPEMAKSDHEEFAKEFATSPQNENGPRFIKRIGNRYGRFTVGQDENWPKWGYPGRYAVEVYIPDVRGGYLSLWVTYRDAADTGVALRIAKSINCKS
jgi:hypothetical protein